MTVNPHEIFNDTSPGKTGSVIQYNFVHGFLFPGQLSDLATLEGVFTVVCVDISYSMTQGDAWQQAKTFFQDFTESMFEIALKTHFETT